LTSTLDDAPSGESCERSGAVVGSAQAASADVANVTTARVRERRVIGVSPREMAPLAKERPRYRYL